MQRSNPNLRTLVVPDGAAILDIERGSMIRLNPAGGHIWEALQQGESVDFIIQRLCSDADVGAEVVAAEVHAFIDELRLQGLLSC